MIAAKVLEAHSDLCIGDADQAANSHTESGERCIYRDGKDNSAAVVLQEGMICGVARLGQAASKKDGRYSSSNCEPRTPIKVLGLFEYWSGGRQGTSKHTVVLRSSREDRLRFILPMCLVLTHIQCIDEGLFVVCRPVNSLRLDNRGTLIGRQCVVLALSSKCLVVDLEGCFRCSPVADNSAWSGWRCGGDRDP